ncbi:MAG TPA: hypothetical protein VJ464_13525 [Blastocatellia bacterium]|nr:hypothetical protein [Blastocatellia bacterium]
MTLEQQVVSLELAKKLKELGVKQESIWYRRYRKGANPEWDLAYVGNIQAVDQKCSAFTVAELGELLPPYFCSFDAKRKYKWSCEKWSHGTINGDVPTQYADTEADARARMVIYLVENKLITL